MCQMMPQSVSIHVVIECVWKNKNWTLFGTFLDPKMLKILDFKLGAVDPYVYPYVYPTIEKYV